MPGRVYSVAISTDGKRIAAGEQPRRHRRGRRLFLRVRHQLARQHQGDQLEGRHRAIGRGSRRARQVPQGGRQADRQRQAAAGGRLRRRVPPDGKVARRRRGRRHDPADQPRDRLVDQGVRPGRRQDLARSPRTRRSPSSRPSRRTARRDGGAPQGDEPRRRWRSSPKEIRLTNRFAYAQLLVTARLDSGETIDVTRMVEATLSTAIAEVSRSGLVRPRADGKATLVAPPGGQVRRGPGDRRWA